MRMGRYDPQLDYDMASSKLQLRSLNRCIASNASSEVLAESDRADTVIFVNMTESLERYAGDGPSSRLGQIRVVNVY